MPEQTSNENNTGQFRGPEELSLPLMPFHPRQSNNSALPGTDSGPLSPLVPLQVRFGLGQELRLFSDRLEVASPEDEFRISLAAVRRLTLTPGSVSPNKLTLTADLDDETTFLVAEKLDNITGLRGLLDRLTKQWPQIELEPPDMTTQLEQALANKRKSQLGCYAILLACGLFFFVIAFLLLHLVH